METYIALLRGINVGGRNKLPMKELRALLADLGLQSVKTYIQSGNAVFLSDSAELAQLATSIQESITTQFGFTPKIMLLPLASLREAIGECPFSAEAADNPKLVHLYFLGEPAIAPNLEKLQALKKESERFELTENVFYLHAPEGIGRSKLAAQAERALGVPATARNWRSATKILALAEEVTQR